MQGPPKTPTGRATTGRSLPTVSRRSTEINAANVGNLKVLCTYDTGQYTGFTSGLIEVEGALIGTTEYDIFSLDPADLPRELAHA